MSGCVVGVDGGQSQVRMRVAGRERISSAPGIGHLEGDSVAALASTVAGLWAEVAASESLGDARIDRLALGVTTLPADATERVRLATLLGELLPVDEVLLAGDAVAAHAGAFPDRHGIVLVVGTGVACFALDAATGRNAMVDGDGFLLGDGGASFWMGREGLSAVLKAADGRGGATALTERSARRFGHHDDLAGYLHALPRPVNEIAQFAAVVQEVALQGDAIAIAIVARAAEELTATAVAASRVFAEHPVPIALMGRVLDPAGALRPRLEARLRETAVLREVGAAGTPLDGACLLAELDPPEYRPHLDHWRRTS